METNTPEEKQKLIRLLTGTDSPKFLTERESVIIDKFLELSSEKDEQLKYCHRRMTEAYNEIRSKESRIALLEEALRANISLLRRCHRLLYSGKHLYHPDIFNTIEKRQTENELALSSSIKEK